MEGKLELEINGRRACYICIYIRIYLRPLAHDNKLNFSLSPAPRYPPPTLADGDAVMDAMCRGIM